MSIITRRQIAALLQDIAQNHWQINTFGWGDVPELLGRQNTIYPFMMVTPEAPIMGEGEVTHVFRISVADRLQKGIENIEEVDSDMYQVLRDVITQIDNVAYQDMRVELPLTIEPFRAEDAQDVYGFSGLVSIIVDENYDQCAIPSDAVPFDPNPPTQICLPALIENSDGSYVVNVASGGNLTLPDVDILVVDINDNPLDSATIPSVKNHTIDVVCVAGTVENSDQSYTDTVVSGGSLTLPDINVTDSDGTTTTFPSVQDVVCTFAADADVENSDQSYSTTVASGGALVLPDQTIEVNGVNEGSIPSVGTIEVELNDDDGNPFPPQAVNITGRKIEIDVNGMGFDSAAFVMLVNTGIAGATNENQFRLNLAGTYDVKTSDGQNLTNQSGAITLTFPYVGQFLIQIFGNVTVNYGAGTQGGVSPTLDRNKLLQVVNWGTSTLTLTRAFEGLNTQVTAKDTPTLGGTSLFATFQARIPIGEAINTWDVSSITTFAGMFRSNTAFNMPLSNWNTAALTTMGGTNAGMFSGAGSFNQNINNFNVSGVTTFEELFLNAGRFNQPLNNWNTSLVQSLNQTFRSATAFNQDISGWNTAAVTNMTFAFFGATAFNQDISGWNTAAVTTFSRMFETASAFNQNLGAWQLRTAGTNLFQIFRNSGMNTANYTDTIVGWANYVFANSGTPANVDMTGQTGRTFTNSRSGGANFADAQAARAYLVSVGWSISGDTVV